VSDTNRVGGDGFAPKVADPLGLGTTIMGVVNVTPDSFVGEIRTPLIDDAITRCHELAAQGASIIDIGGESTRPGALEVPLAEELERVMPVIESVAGALPDGVEISIDTRQADVVTAAVAAGATIVNDMSCSHGALAGSLGASYIAGHMRGTPLTMQDDPSYESVVDEVLSEVRVAANVARQAGAPRVWIDPGIGFGKTIEHNLALLAHIDAFATEDYGVLVGVSRKGTLGRLHSASDLGVPVGSVPPTPTDDRLEASLAIAAWCAMLGIHVIRVHDVAETVQALQVVAARFTV